MISDLGRDRITDFGRFYKSFPPIMIRKDKTQENRRGKRSRKKDE